MMKVLSLLYLSIPLVAAHGFVQNATIGGKDYDVCIPSRSPAFKL